MKNEKIVRKLNIKKLLLIWLFIATIFGVYPTLSKYISSTPEEEITILTKYNVKYETAGGTILQPEKFNFYVSQSGLILPVEGLISRTSYDFLGWRDNEGNVITEIKSGDKGDKLYFAEWKLSKHTLTVKNRDKNGDIVAGLPENYEIVIGKDNNGNDNVIKLEEDGTTIIGKNEVVSIRRQYSEDTDMERFSFDIENIVVDIRYEDGSQYIYYDFHMPKEDLTLTFDNETHNYIDISKSPIVFEENVKVGSVTENGFWYNSSIQGMTPVLQDKNKGNFYAWNNADPLYITSNDRPTKNQITVINTTTLYFKNCVMCLNNEYISKVAGHRIDGTSVLGSTGSYLDELLGKDFSVYGNIIVDGSIHPKYELNIYADGDNNQIGAIFSDQVRNSKTYDVSITFNATESYNKFKLGTAFGNFTFNLKPRVELSQYDYLDENKYKNNFEFLLYSVDSSINISNAIIKAKDKSFMALNGSIAIGGSSRVELCDIFTYTALTCRNNSYVRVHNNIYYGYVPINLTDHASIVIDGNIIANYMHWSGTWTMTSDGYLIVKGNRADMSSTTINNTNVICNALTIGKSFGTNNATIITNQIMNKPEKGFNIKNGEIVYEHTSYLSPTSDNNDNYPFITYSQVSEGNVEYKFNSNIYLFGYYKTIDKDNNKYYDTSVKAIDTGNPIKKYIEKLLDENGDLKNTVQMENSNTIIDDIKKSKLTNNETIIIGNSTYNYDGKNRKVVIEGGNIYSAGNLTFFNDVTMKNGNVYANGNMTSKNDLIIEDGTIQVNDLGNSYNLKKEENINIYLWHETDIKKGTIKANNIGAIKSSSTGEEIIPRSTVTINKEGVTLTGKYENSNCNIISDIYINYIFNPKKFKTENLSDGVRLSTSCDSSSDFSSINWNMEDEIIFTNPKMLTEECEAYWRLNKLSGDPIVKIDNNGNLLNNDGNIGKVYGNKNIKLYAVKDNYSINIKSDVEYNLVDSDTNIPIDSKSVKSGKNIKLTVNDEAYIDKVIISYTDDAGIICNAMPTKQGNVFTFQMPSADVDIYIKNQIILDLDKSSYKINDTGYIVENGNEKNANAFEYKGNLLIEQSSIAQGSKDYFSRTQKKEHTQNTITIESDFNNINNINNTRTITLRKIYQYGGTTSIGLKLEDYAKANIKLSGPIQLFRVEVPEHSKIVLEGATGNQTDLISMIAPGQGDYNEVSLGNYNGKSGEIYLKNINIYNYGNATTAHIGQSKTKTEANITYDNCRIENESWYSGTYLANNFNNVNIINNSVINIKGAPNWPSSLFIDINNVIIKDSTLTLKDNSSYSSSGSTPLHYGIMNELVIDNSRVETSLREYNDTTIYKTVQASGLISPVVRVQNKAIFVTDKRIRFKELIIDGAKMTVGNNADGYLFANHIELNNGGVLNSGNILISGFYDSKGIEVQNEPVTRDDVISKLKNHSNIFDGKNGTGIVIKSGTVNVKDFIGGDVNGKITVEGGELNAKYIGNKGSLYGFGTYVPKSGEEYVYQYSEIPSKGTKVTVNSGIVNVTDSGYLGGMNATVDINGGEVKLSENAIIGINEADTEKLVNNFTSHGSVPTDLVDINVKGGTITGNSGDINVPYSTLDIDSSVSNPGINVRNILAENGTINIKSTANHYDNPLLESLPENNKVGTIVNNNLLAQNIEISGGAVVYAKNAISKTNTSSAKGYLKVMKDSFLYTVHYGAEGSGKSEILIEGTIAGDRNHTIQYVMNDTYEDKAINTNPETYTQGQELELEDPTRFGYEFVGWYDNEGNKVTKISNTAEGNIVLNAKWTEKTVEFVVSIYAKDIGLAKEEFATEVKDKLGTLNESGDKFTYTNPIKVSYHALFNTGLQLSNYNLASYIAAEAKINNELLNPDGDSLTLISDGSKVTREIMEYYLKNNGQPIEIVVCRFVHSANEVSESNMENNIQNNTEGNIANKKEDNVVNNTESNVMNNAVNNIVNNAGSNVTNNTVNNVVNNTEGNVTNNTSNNVVNTVESNITNTTANNVVNKQEDNMENNSENNVEDKP